MLLNMAEAWEGLAAGRVTRVAQRECVWGIPADLFPSIV
jgi:hypothetical protein